MAVDAEGCGEQLGSKHTTQQRQNLKNNHTMNFYSNPSIEKEKWSLPDCQAFQMSAEEVAETMEDEIYELTKRPEFRIATINSRVREKMIETLIEENAIKGGWFYQYCFPGCLPESDPVGPFNTCDDAVKACQEDATG